MNMKMMLRLRTLFVGSILLVLEVHANPQQPGVATALAKPHQERNFQTVATDTNFHYWDKRYLLTWALTGNNDASPNRPAVIAYDAEGNQKDAVVWFDGAARVGVSHVAVTDRGKLIVSGGMRTAEGVIAFYIADIGEDGRVAHVIRTNPFAPVYICSGPDDTIWSYGFDRNENGNAVETAPVLRQFSFEKGQLQAMLPLSSLDRKWRLPAGRYPEEVIMRCNASRVVIYNGNASQWVQYVFHTKALSLRQVEALPPTSKMRISGFAMTDDGDVFASFHQRANAVPMSGLFQLTFEGVGDGQWTPVPGTRGPYLRGSPIERLLGANGNSLVHTRARDGEVYWSNYSKR
ncbi:MAG TPA: hypothetical protein VLA96_04175 [Terriglobales bacterium]|nr:hypothetical protein [Terriglobales bacterium]